MYHVVGDSVFVFILLFIIIFFIKCKFVATWWLNYLKQAISRYRNSLIISTVLLSFTSTNNVLIVNRLENLTLRIYE